MAITLEQAKNLQYGDVLYYVERFDSKGKPEKWRVAGAPRTWKTMPERVVVPLRYGMQKGTCHLSERELGLFCMKEWEATGTKITFKKVAGRSGNYYDVIFGKQKVPYKNLFEDRKIGIVWKNNQGRWNHTQSYLESKTRMEAAIDLLNTMLD